MWERAFFFLVCPLLMFAIVQLTRSRLVGMLIQHGFPIPHQYAVLSLREPPEYPFYRLGILYRLAHNLTLPYVTVAYLLVCLAVFVVLGTAKRKHGSRVLTVAAFVHMAYAALYFVGFILFGPVHSFGVIIPAESESLPPVSESIEGG